LSEWPEAWREHVERWSRLNRRLRREVDGLSLPDANTEYLFYQSLLGVWPLQEVRDEALETLRERLADYMDKATKEAKVHTAWTHANSEYETNLRVFIEAVLDPEHNGAFFEDFLPFQRRISRLGLYNGLSQTLLRLTAPGVPDIYQGCELWSFNLVDPDNRRPVDYARRRTLLEELDKACGDNTQRLALCREMTDHLEDGRAKLYLIRCVLALRQQLPGLFEQGDYLPLPVNGPHADRLCAFQRSHAGRSMIAIAPRLLAGLVPDGGETDDPFSDPGWAETTIEVPTDSLHDSLSGIDLPIEHRQNRLLLCAADLLRHFPVGLLMCASSHG
jgi:(1->4)-alpha-D-glucan 1-alpha-D-glucosylmutase